MSGYNRGERRRQERKELQDADSITKRRETYGRIQYPTDLLQRFVPEGDTPIASRYDPLSDTVHIATAKGMVYMVNRGQLENLPPWLHEASPEVEPEGLPPDSIPPYHVIKARQVGQQLKDAIPPQMRVTVDQMRERWTQRQQKQQLDYIAELMKRAQDEAEKKRCRCAPPGEGSPDAPPCEQHPNGGGRDGEGEGDNGGNGDDKPAPKPPTPTTFDQQWELAEARCEEAKLAGHWGPLCGFGGCKADSAIALLNPRSPACAAHGMLALDVDIARLDWNPEE